MEDNTIIQLFEQQEDRQNERMEKTESNLKDYIDLSMKWNRAKIILELDPIKENQEEPDLVRSIELNIETLHIFPKGFFVAALPSFTFNLNQDFNLFTLGVGAGRALNRRLMVTGGYVHYVAGRRTFNQAFVVGISFIWGKEKVKPEVRSTLKSASLALPSGSN